MSVLNPRTWSLLDWIGAICLAAAAVVQALNAAFKDAPQLASIAPAFLSWAYLPLLLISIAALIILYRAISEDLPKQPPKKTVAKGTQTRGGFQGPFQVTFDPPADFRLLPISFYVDLTAPLPYVQAGFHVVSYVIDETIALRDARMSLRLFGAPPLEAIPTANEDLPIEPKIARVAFFRRNLTDSEIRNLPWHSGHENGSFDLVVKAESSDGVISYKVSAMVIEGWINGPAKLGGSEIQKPRAEPAQSIPAAEEMIALSDAASTLYEVARSLGRYLAIAAERTSGSDERGQMTTGAPEDILDYVATYMAGKSRLFGCRPPSDRREAISFDEAKRGTFENGALVLKTDGHVYTDLAISKIDLRRMAGALEKNEI